MITSMTQDREVEAKTILAEDSFKKIVQAFAKKEDLIQTNYYFDSSDWILRAHSSGLRIRLFADHAEQTLKVPDLRPIQKAFHEVIEINDDLDLNEAASMVSDAKKGKTITFSGSVGSYINQHYPRLMSKLQIFTWSKTHRLLLNGPSDCELTLDETLYPDSFKDYELEIENTNPKTIASVLKQLEKQFAFAQTPANSNQNKVARAIKHRK